MIYFIKKKIDRLFKIFSIALFLLVSYTGARSQVGSVIWEDNFNSLNTDIWVPDIGDGCPTLCGWGNAELQSYESGNVYIADVPGEPGNKALVLEARNETSGSRAFTSGKVTTESRLSVHYGLIEVRMRVPNLQTGLWPAAWLLGTSNLTWPGKGEIDMMEMGHAQAARAEQGHPGSSVNNYVGGNAIFQTEDGGVGSIAYDVDYNQPYVSSTPMNDRFVTYRLYWEPSQMRFAVVDNGVEHDLYTNPLPLDPSGVTGAFTKPFYLLLNLAVGGNFTDAATNGQVTAPLPGRMYIDYVRVSEWNGHGEVAFNYGELQPEAGVFGVFTDNTITSNALTFGTDAEIYAWGGTLQQGNTDPYEGSNVIAWETTAANSWFGGGVVATYGKNMSNYVENGSLKFKIRIPANVSFRIGITDNYTNETYINFPAFQNQYGLARNGEWGQVEIPLTDFAGILAFQNIGYMFAITSLEGALPSSTFQLAVDDIIWDDGNGATTPVTGVSVSPATVSLAPGEQQQLTESVFPVNATNKNVSWSSSNASVATVSSSGLVTAQSAGTATITVTTVDGNYTASAAITVSTANVLPSPWQTIDVGDVAAGGSASFTGGTFTLEGSGADIWGNSDEFRFVYQEVNGDLTITARVNSLTNTDAWAKAGVMIRESLSGSSKHALSAITPASISAFQRRMATGGSSSHTAGTTANAPHWVKLERSGNTFTSSVSSNGSSWTIIGAQSIDMSEPVYVGLAVTSHNDGALCTATFSNVEVSAGSGSFATLPGMIQAEDYNQGGEGVAYHDTTPGNTGGAYRNDDVDIEITGDVDGGYNVGWIGAGEWLDYTVTATASSNNYEFRLRVASPDGNGRLHIEIDGQNVTGTLAAPNTGSWQNYETVIASGISIAPGNHTMRIYFEAAGLNLNYIEVVESTSSPAGCTQQGPNGDYVAEIADDDGNSSITFVPGAQGIGNSVLILYYGTDPNVTFPGYAVTPNTPHPINASSGQTVYFYYTYSMPGGGERNSSADRHSFVMGNCSSSSRVAAKETRVDGEVDWNEQMSSFELFPNPSADRITLRIPYEFGASSVTIMDIRGRNCIKLSISDGVANQVIDIRDLSEGIYLLQVETPTQRPEVLRFIKN